MTMLAGIHIIRTTAAMIPTKLSPTNFPENHYLFPLMRISVCLIIVLKYFANDKPAVMNKKEAESFGY